MKERPPLFIPLKAEFYIAFEAGTKKFEYRKHGGPWTEKNVWVGRPATLSYGYGKARRMSGVVSSVEIVPGKGMKGVEECYGTDDIDIIKIGIKLNGDPK